MHHSDVDEKNPGVLLFRALLNSSATHIAEIQPGIVLQPSQNTVTHKALPFSMIFNRDKRNSNGTISLTLKVWWKEMSKE